MPGPLPRGTMHAVRFQGLRLGQKPQHGAGRPKKDREWSFYSGLRLARILPILFEMHEAQVVEFAGYPVGRPLLSVLNQENNRSDGWRI